MPAIARREPPVRVYHHLARLVRKAREGILLLPKGGVEHRRGLVGLRRNDNVREDLFASLPADAHAVGRRCNPRDANAAAHLSQRFSETAHHLARAEHDTTHAAEGEAAREVVENDSRGVRADRRGAARADGGEGRNEESLRKLLPEPRPIEPASKGLFAIGHLGERCGRQPIETQQLSIDAHCPAAEW